MYFIEYAYKIFSSNITEKCMKPNHIKLISFIKICSSTNKQINELIYFYK